MVLLPLAGWFIPVFAPAPAAAVVEGLGVQAALAGLVGTALLLLTGWPLWVNGLITAILAAALLPVAFAGTTLQFYDLRRRAASSAADLSDAPVAAS